MSVTRHPASPQWPMEIHPITAIGTPHQHPDMVGTGFPRTSTVTLLFRIVIRGVVTSRNRTPDTDLIVDVQAVMPLRPTATVTVSASQRHTSDCASVIENCKIIFERDARLAPTWGRLGFAPRRGLHANGCVTALLFSS